MRRNNKVSCLVFSASLAACSNSAEPHHHDESGAADDAISVSCNTGEPPPALGLMTSLPLNWELGSGIEDFAQGKTKRPWQAVALSSCFSTLPLDTLSPIDGLAPDGPKTDPLAGLSHLAIIQPRGLTPADNAALDNWVRAGGDVLLVLDPMLTGHYELPLGDPRRPLDSALYAVPPVVPRWGLEAEFLEPAAPEDGIKQVDLGGVKVRIEHGFGWKVIDNKAASCDSYASAYVVRCKVGEGHVTLFGDAALFEHREVAGDKFEAITALLEFAFPR